MIKTIEEASKVLAGQWLPAPELMPQGWPENIEAVTDEFRLGIFRTLSVGQFKTDLLRLVSDGKITPRSATGSYLSPQSEPAESALVDVFEARAAFEAEGMKFQYAESAASSGAPESAGLKIQATSGVDRNDSTPPGKLPNVACGRLAVFAAWKIEGEKQRAATQGEVMALLQTWADDGSHPETLMKSVKGKRAVEWKTKSGKPRIYDIDACGKTLDTWMKSRA